MQFYMTHFKKVHKDVPPEFQNHSKYYCDQCPEFFVIKARLTQHISMRHSKNKKSSDHSAPKRRYQCKYCEKSYTTNNNLQEHIMAKHEKNTPLKCEHCPKAFGLQSTLTTHYRVVHMKMDCDVCGQKVYNPFELKRHRFEAHGIMPVGHVKCELCVLIFKSKKLLEDHIKTKH